MKRTPATGKLFLIHWNPSEAEALAGRLRAAGWSVEIEAEDGDRGAQRVLDSEPQAVLIYLTRMPSHGRRTGRYLRTKRSSDELPIFFIGGNHEKVAEVRREVPEARFLDADELTAALAELPPWGGN